jgi:hypothetical protein
MSDNRLYFIHINNDEHKDEHIRLRILMAVQNKELSHALACLLFLLSRIYCRVSYQVISTSG